MNKILEIKNISKTFKITSKQQKIEKTKEKLKVAVDNLSLDVYEGEIYGLLGPNGAGKTTTLRMVATFLNPDHGNISVCGIDSKENPKEVRSSIGFLTSEMKLEPGLTPNFIFDFFCDLYQIDKDEREKRKEELFNRFDISKFKEVKIGDLSTGMKQKVSLVISIIHNPKFIIFDEPTNGLDIITAKTVLDFLLELKKDGKTIILSTHIFDLVEKLCDRVGIIVNGKMIKEDNLDNLTKELSLEEVFFDLYYKEVGEE